MGTETKIQWCDHTASPWHGCSEVHAGCDQCYARELSKRNPSTLGTWGPDGTRVESKSFHANCRRWNKAAEQSGVRQSVFPSLCDPFEDHESLPEMRQRLFETIDACPMLDFLLLTKRPENVRRMWTHSMMRVWKRHPDDHGPTPRYRGNVWIITSVSDQATADEMIPDLLKCRALVPVLGLSAEPLLGSLHLDCALSTGDRFIDKHIGWLDVLDWVILGGESGPRARPCDIGWIRDIRDQCQAAGVPVFVKQLGAFAYDQLDPRYAGHTVWNNGTQYAAKLRLRDSKGGDWLEWPADLRVREMPQLVEAR